MRKRSAFSLVELIFVIVILGIVGMIGSDIIAKMYQGYLKSQITNRLQSQTELVLDQIAARLKYRIKDSVIGRNSATNAYMKLSDDNISNIAPNMIEWIGYDIDSFRGESNGTYARPGWSGFVDVNSTQTTRTQILMPGSELNVTESVIDVLSNHGVSIANGAVGDSPILVSKCFQDSNMSRWGWDTNPHLAAATFDANLTVRVRRSAPNALTTLTMANVGEREICEQYYLAWSAYAIVPEGDVNNTTDFNLTLRYNYQPWEREDYRTPPATSQLLAEHVSTFRAMQVGDSIRIKLCIQDGNITGTPYGFCKEKAIY